MTILGYIVVINDGFESSLLTVYVILEPVM